MLKPDCFQLKANNLHDWYQISLDAFKYKGLLSTSQQMSY